MDATRATFDDSTLPAHRSWLVAQARRRGFTRAESDDLASEALLRLQHGAAARFDGRCSAKTYLRRILNHVIADYIERGDPRERRLVKLAEDYFRIEREQSEHDEPLVDTGDFAALAFEAGAERAADESQAPRRRRKRRLKRRAVDKREDPERMMDAAVRSGVLPQPDEGRATQLDSVLADELADAVAAEMQRLDIPKEAQEALLDPRWDGCTVSEIAAAIGMPRRTLASQIEAAKKKLATSPRLRHLAPRSPCPGSAPPSRLRAAIRPDIHERFMRVVNRMTNPSPK